MNLQSSQLSARRYAVVTVLAILCSVGHDSLLQAQGTDTSDGLRDMASLDAGVGWVFLTNKLYWTQNSGNSWLDITPLVRANEKVEKVFFLNKSSGWMLISRNSRINGQDVPSWILPGRRAAVPPGLDLRFYLPTEA